MASVVPGDHLQLGADGLAIIPTAPERPRNRDSDYLFRHDSYFYYLTGFSEPNAWLAITGDGRSTLFCAPKDLEREIWDGYRLGPEAAPEALGVDAAHSVDELDQRLPRLRHEVALREPMLPVPADLARHEDLGAGRRDAIRVPGRPRPAVGLQDAMDRMVGGSGRVTHGRRPGGEAYGVARAAAPRDACRATS